MTKKILFWEPQFGSSEKKYFEKALKADFPNEGPLTEIFENKLAKLLDVKFAIATTSGTAALFLSLKALGIGTGDEVIVPDITFIATAAAVEMTGAKPVFADISRSDLNIDTSALEKLITKRTKAVIPVHVSGRAAGISKILKIAKANKISVVEDAAEALLSKVDGKALGTFGDMGCFSFSPNKTITTGQGGLVITDNSSLYNRIKELKDQGRSKRGTGGDDIHSKTGYNFKYTDIQAAVGLGQLDFLKFRLSRQKKIHSIYLSRLRDVKEVSVYKTDIASGQIPQWTDIFAKDRDALFDHLKKNNMVCRKYWHPLHTQLPYRQSGKNFPNSIECSKASLWLPSAFTLSDEDVNKVCDKIEGFIKGNDNA